MDTTTIVVTAPLPTSPIYGPLLYNNDGTSTSTEHVAAPPPRPFEAFDYAMVVALCFAAALLAVGLVGSFLSPENKS